MSWFSDIYGFEESTYARTQAKFCIDGPLLHTRGQSSRTFHAGILTMPSLAELRKAVCSLEVSGGERIKLSSLVADAYELHRWPEANRAIIQVASQFNLLEMPNEHTTPEKGSPTISTIIRRVPHVQWPVPPLRCFVTIWSRLDRRGGRLKPVNSTLWRTWTEPLALGGSGCKMATLFCNRIRYSPSANILRRWMNFRVMG